MKTLRVIIAAGGTGGHIFPALALAEEIRSRRADSEILFVGTPRGLEEKIFVGNGYPLRILHMRGLIRGWSPMDIVKNILLPFQLVSVMGEAWSIVREFQPDAVIGCGGYVTGPVLVAAAMQHVPTLVQEQNSRPGRTTVWLSHLVDEVHITYEESERFFSPKGKLVVSGNPVRQSMQPIDRRQAAVRLGLDPERKTLLVIGGSLGAKSINRAMASNAECLTENMQIVWQTGTAEYEKLSESFSGRPGIHVYAFLDDMASAYSAADLVVCRAGAMTLAELTVMGKPAILVPYPYAADNHQEYNAQSLVTREAAIRVRDSDIDGQLKRRIEELMGDDARRERMGSRSAALRRPDAAKRIIDALMKRLN